MSNLAKIAAIWLLIAQTAAAQTGVLAIAAGVDDSIVSVLDHGAVPDDGTDDGEAIQGAINSVSTTGGTVYFPTGYYIVASRELSVPYGCTLIGEGRRPGGGPISQGYGTIIERTGSVGTLFNPVSGCVFTCSNMLLESTGHVFDMTETNNCTLSDLFLASGAGSWAVYCEGNTFGNRYEQIKCLGNGLISNNGIMLQTHTTLRDYDANALAEAVRIAHGQGVRIEGQYRIEVCTKGIVIGMQYDGSGVQSSYFSITASGSMESNTRAIVIHSANLFQLCNTVIYGFQNQYPAPPATTGGNGSSALEILGSCSKGLFAQVNAGGYIPGAPAVTWGNLHNCRLTNFFPGNSASGPAYQTTLPLPNGDSNTIDQSDLLVNSSDTLAYGLTARSLRTYSLHGVDYLTPAKQGKNVRFINLAVSAGAATKAVTFSPGFSGGAIDFSSLTASNGAGTLPPATYYYLGTVTTPGGECRGLERSVVVSAPNDTVDLAIYGLVGATNYKLRIYRGTATGVYGGCYELPLNTGTYTDTNASFDIVGALPPGDGVNDNSMQEPDANYAVLVTPSWLTTHRVTSKATTGFTVDFGTAAPGGGGTIDIMMVR